MRHENQKPDPQKPKNDRGRQLASQIDRLGRQCDQLNQLVTEAIPTEPQSILKEDNEEA
jgi:hypothetical protein